MATIYRFIIEGKGKGGNGVGGGSEKKKTAKTFTALSMFKGGSDKGGVEYNRLLRAVNPSINKITNGYWEKGLRVGRAGLGMVKFKQTKTGGMAYAGLSISAIAIILALLFATTIKHHKKQIDRVDKENKSNYKKMETGESAIHGNYTVSRDFWNGRITYNENK